MANTALPVISGTATQGQMLTVSDGLWTNSPTSYTRQWVRCDAAGANCVLLPSSSSSSYMLVAADVGATIRCWVTSYNAAGASEAVSTAQTGVVAALAAGVPVLITAPTAPTGNPVQGQVLTIGTGSWTNSPTKYGHCWTRCDANGANCVTIANGQDCTNATPNATYTLVAADVGKTIKAYTTAVNATGNSIANLSAATAVIGAATAPPPPPPQPAASFVGDFDTGNTSQYGRSGFVGWNLPRITVVTADGAVRPQKGTHMCRMELRNGEHAPWTAGADIVGLVKSYYDTVNTESYHGFSLYIPAGFSFAPNTLFNIFYELHGDNNFFAATQIVVNVGSPPGSLVPTWAFVPNFGGSQVAYNMEPVQYGRWTNFVQRSKWSTGTSGLHEVWVNGVKRVSIAGKNWYSSGQTTVTPQVVYYRSAHTATVVFYYDSVRIGTSYAAVAP